GSCDETEGGEGEMKPAHRGQVVHPSPPARHDVVGDRSTDSEVADDAHVIDTVEQLDVDGREVTDCGTIVRCDHQFVVRTCDDGDWALRGGETVAVVVDAEVADQAIGVHGRLIFLGMRGHRKRDDGQVLATGHTKPAQKMQCDYARN